MNPIPPAPIPLNSETNYDPAWDAVYRAKAAPMKYPHDGVIRFVLAQHPRHKPRSETRILEVGCGMGNNLWFAAREGFQVAGLDASTDAIAYARTRFAEEKLAGEFAVAMFGNLAFADGSFDLVIDEGGLTCTGRSVAAATIREIRRVLTDRGKFLFTPFSKADASFRGGDPGPDDTVINIRAGTITGRGQICFYDQADIERIFSSGWKVLSMEHCPIEDRMTPDPVVRARWRVIAEKVAG